MGRNFSNSSSLVELTTTTQQVSSTKSAVSLRTTPPKTNTAFHWKATSCGLESLPDELIEGIISLVGLGRSSNSLDPFGVGWQEEAQVVREAIEFERALRPLRLVSWRFFHLATPLFFKRLIISDLNCNIPSGGRLIVRLTELLDSRPPARTEKPNQLLSFERTSAQTGRGFQRSHHKNGHHVQKLIISSSFISPVWVFRLLDAIHFQLPNLSELSSLNLSHLPILLSPAISFPRLESLSGIDAGPFWDARTLNHSSPLFARPSSTELSNSLIPQEILLGFLNHHPNIRHFSCRGLHLNLSVATRLLAVLRSNQLVVPLLPPSRRSLRFSGLSTLHIGLHSLVDLQFLRLLPSSAPQLEQLHLDAGCQIEDKSADPHDEWAIHHLTRALPQLSYFTFIGQHDLPSRHRSMQWVASSQLLKVSPRLRSLNLRADTFETPEFFDDLGKTALQRLNIWHRPLFSHASENWSIISFDTPQSLERLGHFARALTHAGLEWPNAEELRRDLWLKFRALSQMENDALGAEGTR